MQAAMSTDPDEGKDIPGAWVRAARKVAGLTQMDLAFRAKKALSTVQRWEYKSIDFISWRGVLSVLGLPEDWRPTGEDDIPQPRKPQG